jgi:hypothetical protein
MSNGICAIHERCDDSKRRPTYGELSVLLQSESRYLSKLFVVIDALDEYSYVDDATPKLLIEIQKLQPSLHLLVTSRSHLGNVIQLCLPDAIRLEIRAHDEDIKKYVDKRIRMEKYLGFLIKKTPELREAVKNTITEKAKGM